MHREHQMLQFPKLAAPCQRDASLGFESESSRDGLLDSWKEIAGFLGREVRTVQLWEKREGLPVHRHFHVSRASVHAYRSELLAWQTSRRMLGLRGAVPLPLKSHSTEMPEILRAAC